MTARHGYNTCAKIVIMRKIFKAFSGFLLSAALISAIAGGCVTTPETGRTQLMLLDARTELKLGADAYRDILKKSKISQDRRLTGIVRKVGWSIARVTGRSDYKWEFNLIENKTPNAFALPGGKVGINTGILSIAKNEAGLSAVMGHEVAHAIARHGAERMSQSLLIALGGELLAQGMGQNQRQRQGIRAAYGIGSAVAFTLPFSRSNELEADYMGLLYMARAGYDPREAKRFWARFARYSREKGKNSTPEFLSTHPADANRIRQIDGMMAQALKEYERSGKLGVGEEIMGTSKKRFVEVP